MVSVMTGMKRAGAGQVKTGGSAGRFGRFGGQLPSRSS
jgi:hypothetical protein